MNKHENPNPNSSHHLYMFNKEREHRVQLEKLASIAGFEWDVETNEFWWSDQIIKILKLKNKHTPPSLQNFISFIHPNEQKKVQIILENLIKSNEDVRLHTRILSADGNDIPILLKASFNKEEHKVIGFIQDVSEDIMEKNNLLDTLSKYRGVMSGAGDAIILLSLKGHIIEGNAKAAEILDIKEDEISTLSIDEIHLKDDFDEMMGHYQGMLWGQDRLIKSTIVSKKNRHTPVEISGRTIYIGKEQILVIILHDLTLQKQAEDALKHSEQRYRSLVNEAREGILLLDFKGEILSVNPKVCEALNMKRAQLLQCSFADITQFDSVESPIILLENAKQKSSIHVEGFLKSTTNISIPTGFNIAKFDNKGTIQYIVTAYDLSTVRDGETERLELQKQLFQSQKLEILGQLAGSLAHDFNNLLSPILLVSEILIEDAANDEFLKRNLNNINLAAQRARRLVGRILDYTRPEDSEPMQMDLCVELEDMLELLRSSIPSSIKIETKIPDQEFICFADPDQINQVLMNISMNASHSIGETGGIITFSLDRIQIDENSPLMHEWEMSEGSYAKLCVSDTGNGIPEEILDKIFEPFFTTKAQTEGSGLGLSVVKRILENHHGFIFATNNTDKGVTMTLYLPLLKA